MGDYFGNVDGEFPCGGDMLYDIVDDTSGLNMSLDLLSYNMSSEMLLDSCNLTSLLSHVYQIIGNDPFRKLMEGLNAYVTPLTIAVGLVGNAVSFLVFTRTHLKRQSSSIYLASLALIDIVFLFSLIIVWLSWIKVPLLHTQGFCQAVVYLLYVTSCLSMWYVVGFTVDRYVTIMCPLRKEELCTAPKAKVLVSIVGVVTLLVFAFSVRTSGVYVVHSPTGLPLRVCMPLPRYHDFHTVVHIIDSVINLVVPSTVIIVLNLALARRIVHYSLEARRSARSLLSSTERRRTSKRTMTATQILLGVGTSPSKPAAVGTAGAAGEVTTGKSVGGVRSMLMQQDIVRQANRRAVNSLPPMPNYGGREDGGGGGGHQFVKHASSGAKGHSLTTSSLLRCHTVNGGQTGTFSPGGKRRVLQMRIRQERMRAQFRTARTLIIVSSVFVALNIPSYAFRNYAFIKSSLDENYTTRRRLLLWQELFQLLHHLSFAINCFLYSICGRQFRMAMRVLGFHALARLPSRLQQSCCLGKRPPPPPPPLPPTRRPTDDVIAH